MDKITENVNDVIIRLATENDIHGLLRLLEYILNLHHSGRPDIFKPCGSKYGENELKNILRDEKTPVFIATNSKNDVIGYAFCIEKEIKDNRVLQSRKILYLDDLCVDETFRGQGIGGKLMDAVKMHGAKIKANNLELNVWGFNKSAIAFYEHLGFAVQKSTLEMQI